MSELTMQQIDVAEGIKYNVKGRITTVNENYFDKILGDALEDGNKTIILNMREVTIMTSIGIRIILKTYKSCVEAGGKFQIEEPSDVVKNVLGLSALQQMMVY